MIIDNKEYNNFLFIHIPKTGGTSINNTFEKNNLKTWNTVKNYGHDPLYILKNNNTVDNNTFIFSIVRNPYTRAFSYWKHFNINNAVNLSFMEFLLTIENKIQTDQTPWIIYDQTFFLYDKEINITKLYKFENLKEIEKDFNIILSHDRKGIYNKNIKDYFDLNIISKINNLYHRDFINFEYDKISKVEHLENT
jgi:hypothetical protein